MKMKIKIKIYQIAGIFILFLMFFSACNEYQSSVDQINTDLSSLISNEANQIIPDGFVYLGDKDNSALGFNMSAGGAIGSLLYNGKDLIDRTDYGRYIQLSLYDGDQIYEHLENDPFGNWGWNPIQAGSISRKPAKVLEFRKFDKGLYIKSIGKEWGKENVDSDVIFETWALKHDSFFEIHIRAINFGSDDYSARYQEYPAAYFSESLKNQIGYFGNSPFTAQPLDQYLQKGTFTNCPTLTPTENWMAYSNDEGIGLILAIPPQPYLTSIWKSCIFDGPVNYLSPLAFFGNPANTSHEVVFYLIPGPIDKGRTIVYDLLPHTTWTFDLNSLEGWQTDSTFYTIDNGILTILLTSEISIRSSPLNIPMIFTPSMSMFAKSIDSESDVCVSFITKNDQLWDAEKTACVHITPDEFQRYTFKFRHSWMWENDTISQFRISSSEPIALMIDSMKVDSNGLSWDFKSDEDSEGWLPLNQIANLEVHDGKIHVKPSGSEPYIVSPRTAFSAKDFPIIKIRMRLSSGSNAQFFFTSSNDGRFDGHKSMLFSVNPDNKYHTYTINMASNDDWVDLITQIRFDLAGMQSSFDIDYIRLTRSNILNELASLFTSAYKNTLISK